MEAPIRPPSHCPFCKSTVIIRERKLPDDTHVLFYFCRICDQAYYFTALQAKWLAMDV